MDNNYKNLIKQARVTNLFNFLKSNHYNLFTEKSGSLHPKDNNSLSIRKDYCGYYDFANGDHGNSIDFLVNYMGYSFVDAVAALTQTEFSNYPKYQKVNSERPETTNQNDNSLTSNNREIAQVSIEKCEGDAKKLFAYLHKTRNIPYSIIRELYDKGLLFLDKKGNVVFINEKKTYAELRGTYSEGKAFKGKVNTDKLGYWHFSFIENPKQIYICEGAIDAISLYAILNDRESAYASIGGVTNQQLIDQIKKDYEVVISAFDNDKAGDECRERNQDLVSIKPQNPYKDFNEFLQKNGGKIHDKITGRTK